MDGNAALAVLGLRPGAPRREIKEAFRRRAKLVHPDHDGAAEHFLVLHRAYRVALRATAVVPAAGWAIAPSDAPTGSSGPGGCASVAPRIGGTGEGLRPILGPADGAGPPATEQPMAGATVPGPRGRRGWAGRWSTTPATPAATIDVLDVRRPAASATPPFRTRTTMSFDGHLAAALTG